MSATQTPAVTTEPIPDDEADIRVALGAGYDPVAGSRILAERFESDDE